MAHPSSSKGVLRPRNRSDQHGAGQHGEKILPSHLDGAAGLSLGIFLGPALRFQTTGMKLQLLLQAQGEVFSWT